MEKDGRVDMVYGVGWKGRGWIWSRMEG